VGLFLTWGIPTGKYPQCFLFVLVKNDRIYGFRLSKASKTPGRAGLLLNIWNVPEYIKESTVKVQFEPIIMTSY